MTQRKSYTPEFKEEAIRRAKERGFSQAARDLGINVSLARRGNNRLEEDTERPFPEKGHPRDEEMARMNRELKPLEEENAILKKAVGIR